MMCTFAETVGISGFCHDDRSVLRHRMWWDCGRTMTSLDEIVLRRVGEEMMRGEKVGTRHK